MPQYEYECVQDGEILTLLRPMRDADAPVEDPSGKGRTFKRRHSVFGVGSGGAGSASQSTTPVPGSCACGLKPGSCGGS